MAVNFTIPPEPREPDPEFTKMVTTILIAPKAWMPHFMRVLLSILDKDVDVISPISHIKNLSDWDKQQINRATEDLRSAIERLSLAIPSNRDDLRVAWEGTGEYYQQTQLFKSMKKVLTEKGDLVDDPPTW